MALEHWELAQRQKGNIAGAEIAKTLRKQYGDVPLGVYTVRKITNEPIDLTSEQEGRVQRLLRDDPLKYTGRAKLSLLRAKEEAEKMGDSAVNTEHILLGLLGDENGIAGEALMGIGVDLSKAREEVEDINNLFQNYSNLPLSDTIAPRAQRLIRRAESVRNQLSDSQVDSFHLLIGLTMDCDGLGGMILQGPFNINLEDLSRNAQLLRLSALGKVSEV